MFEFIGNHLTWTLLTAAFIVVSIWLVLERIHLRRMKAQLRAAEALHRELSQILEIEVDDPDSYEKKVRRAVQRWNR